MNMLLNVANCTLIFLKTIKFPRTNEHDFLKDQIMSPEVANVSTSRNKFSITDVRFFTL